MQRQFGFVTTRGIPTWFGELKPNLVTIKTGPTKKDVVQLPMGQFTLPNIENPIYARFDTKDSTPGFLVTSSVRRKEQAVLIKLCADAREILQAESIYRGRAIRLVVDDEGMIEFEREPEFLDLSNVSEDDIVFNADTARLIETNLFTPMKKTELCRQHRIPLKRGILFEGPYGCGKSLTARVAAKVASDNDWTFITLDRAQGLQQAIEFARLFQPAMIFAEDIDRVADRGDEKVNYLINLMDGILTKDVEIIVVLTTNFITKIDRALLRPGRFDAVIRIDAPDTEAVIKLMRYYGGSLVDGYADLTEAAAVLAGQIPATVREVVERAKLSMILEERTNIEPHDLRAAAVGMTRHLELLAEKTASPSAAERFAIAIREIVGVQTPAGDPEIKAKLEGLRRLTTIAASEASKAKEQAADGSAAAQDASLRGRSANEKLDDGLKELKTIRKVVENNF